MLSNGDLVELLIRDSEQEEGHRRRALDRASRAAMFRWPVEAADLAAEPEPVGSLTELPGVGPWVAGRLLEWMADPPADREEPPGIRRGFLTQAEVRSTLTAHPDWVRDLRGDLQMHTTYSDGTVPMREMIAAADALGYRFVGITDHSKSLKVAGGMDEERLAEQGRDIDEANEELRRAGSRLFVLRSIEMDLLDGEGDMEPAALASLDLVLGAFHTKLRQTEDQTVRYLAALQNRTVNVLAHPTTRMYGRRLGLPADWNQVFDAAAIAGKAVEIDGSPARQDLPIDLVTLAARTGVTFSLGSDAHAPGELAFMDYAAAAAIRAGIAKERILNFLPPEEIIAWAGSAR